MLTQFATIKEKAMHYRYLFYNALTDTIFIVECWAASDLSKLNYMVNLGGWTE